MIKTSELRLGNITANGTIVRLTEISSRVLYSNEHFKDKQSWVYEEHLEPVLLTDEILINNGFLYQYELFFTISTTPNHTISLRHAANNGVNCFRIDGMVDLQYLHQLQNLYFALTGKELTVNL